MRVEDVAAEAEVSPALVYYYFETKDRLIRRAFEFSDARAVVSTYGGVDGRMNGLEKVEFVLVNEVADTSSSRENWVFWSETSAAAVFDEELRGSLAAWGQKWVKTVADFIRTGQEDGSIPPEAEASDSAEVLTALVDSVGTRWMQGMMSLNEAHRLIRSAIASQLRTAVQTQPVE